MSETVALYSVDEVARKLGIEPRRVKQLIRDHILFQYTNAAGETGIPQEILIKGKDGYEPLYNLPGTLTLLSDGGFSSGCTPSMMNWEKLRCRRFWAGVIIG